MQLICVSTETMKYFRIGIAGAGNLAWHLAQDLEKTGHVVPVIYSRNREKAEIIAQQLYETEILQEPDFTGHDLDLLLLAISDDAIQSFSNQMVVEEQTIVAHCAGSVPMDVLQHLLDNYGVFYPLQTFSTEKAIDFKDIPVCIESESAHVHDVLYAVGKSLGCKVVVMDSEQRKWLHLAAVFTCNFTNHMLFHAKTLLDSEGIDFSLLKPLARETIDKAFMLTPEIAQTGPASRNDEKTLQMHLEKLRNNPEIADLYRRISTSIFQNSF